MPGPKNIRGQPCKLLPFVGYLFLGRNLNLWANGREGGKKLWYAKINIIILFFLTNNARSLKMFFWEKCKEFFVWEGINFYSVSWCEVLGPVFDSYNESWPIWHWDIIFVNEWKTGKTTRGRKIMIPLWLSTIWIILSISWISASTEWLKLDRKSKLIMYAFQFSRVSR